MYKSRHSIYQYFGNSWMKLKIGLFITFLLFGSACLAQIDNKFLEDPVFFNKADSGKAGFSIINNNYLRNTEYYSVIEYGRTLFGSQIMPSFYYQVNKNVRLQGGVYVRKDFGGKNPFTETYPTFSLILQNDKQWNFIFGTLQGTLNHRMVEPTLDIAAYIEKHIENGFQLTHNTDKLFFDAWLNWEKFIERGSPYKEQLTAGINYQPRLFLTHNGFSITPIIQGMIAHKGGQISTDTSLYSSIADGNIGLQFRKLNKSGFIKEMKFEPYLLFYKRVVGNIEPYTNGRAVYLNAEVKMKNLTVMFSYWDGNKYIAPKGTLIYGTVSIDDHGYFNEYRKLLLLHVFYEKTIYEKLRMSIRFEPFYNFPKGYGYKYSNGQYGYYEQGMFEYSYSLYLTYSGNWSFRKQKK